MKFNTDKYKLSLFTELECEDCIKLKEQLTLEIVHRGMPQQTVVLIS